MNSIRQSYTERFDELQAQANETAARLLAQGLVRVPRYLEQCMIELSARIVLVETSVAEDLCGTQRMYALRLETQVWAHASDLQAARTLDTLCKQ